MFFNKKDLFTEYLDYTLDWFTKNPSDFNFNDLTPRQNVTSLEIANSIIKENKNLNSTEFSYYFELLLDKLHSDNYIDKEHNTRANKVDSSKFIYSVTLSAFIFKKEGGYYRQLKKQRLEAFWDKIENMPKRYWFVGLFIVTQAYNLNDLRKDFLKFLSSQTKKAPLPIDQTKDTNNHKYK